MRNLLSLVMLLSVTNGFAQITMPLPRLYWQNNYIINTAAINNENRKNAFAGISFDPSSYGGGIIWAGYTQPLNGRHNLGTSLGNFAIRNGLNNYDQTWFTISYIYKIELAEKSSIGFSADAKYMLNQYDNMWDPDWAGKAENGIARQAGISFSTYFTKKQFYAGAALSNPLVLNFNSKMAENNLQTIGYLHAGYNFILEKDKIEMQPKALFRYGFASKNYLVDLNNSFVFANKFTLGASYRSNSENEDRVFGINAGLKIRKKFSIGLAGDLTNTYQEGVLRRGEFILSYQF